MADQDPFERLHKMSTTAGVGAGDYVAISGTAIASVLFGVASVTVLFGGWFLLAIPLAGVALAIVAWVQVSRSAGTLTGRGLAAIGLLLSLGLGGYQGGRTATDYRNGRTSRRQIVQLVHDFGQDLATERYANAYSKFDADFRNQVPMATFEGLWRSVHKHQLLGTLTGVEWNGLLQFTTDVTHDQPTASGMVLVEFNHSPESARTDMFFRQIDGRWFIDRMPQFFAPNQQPGAPTSANPARTSGQPLGPPRPR